MLRILRIVAQKWKRRNMKNFKELFADISLSKYFHSKIPSIYFNCKMIQNLLQLLEVIYQIAVVSALS